MRLTTTAITYLELCCCGMTPVEIGRRYSRDPKVVAKCILRAARIVSRLGFWKFDVRYVSDVPIFRDRLLSNLMTHGYLMARAA